MLAIKCPASGLVENQATVAHFSPFLFMCFHCCSTVWQQTCACCAIVCYPGLTLSCCISYSYLYQPTISQAASPLLAIATTITFACLACMYSQDLRMRPQSPFTSILSFIKLASRLITHCLHYITQDHTFHWVFTVYKTIAPSFYVSFYLFHPRLLIYIISAIHYM
jgi:hypothetical protein